MKKTIIIFITLFLIKSASFAQVYKELLDSAELYYTQDRYFEAYDNFRAAKTYGKKVPSIVLKAEKGMDKSIASIKVAVSEMKKQKKIADYNAEKAKEWQLKINLGKFDDAVKKHYYQWTGYEIFSDAGEGLEEDLEARNEILSKIDTLDFSNQNLLFLPKQILECKNLKSINLAGNPNIDWQDCFTKLSSLKSLTDLNLNNNKLRKIPEEIKHFNNLIRLSLSRNNLDSLPIEIGELIKLEELLLNNNNLTNLPTSFGNLVSLTNLNLSVNKLTSLPSEIGSLTNIKELLLNNNKLINLPNNIGNLKNLVTIHLNINKLTSLPIEIRNLTNVKELLLYNNLLTALPKEIGQLTKLTKLNLQNNQLISLPIEIGNLLNLTELNLQRNQLKSVPCELANLNKLVTLNLSYNMLITFPKSILKLKKLQSLLIMQNLISIIPKDIRFMQGLNHFNISYNQITKLPKELKKLKHLERIYLTGNRISNINILNKNIVIKQIDVSSFSKLTLNNGTLNEAIQVPTDKQSGARKSTIAIILNYTAGPYKQSVSTMTNPRVKASTHFIIDKDGSITQIVNSNNIAWHAGKSSFNNLEGFNKHSIGIEFVNDGSLTKDGDNYRSWYGAIVNSTDAIEATHRNETVPKYWQTYTKEQISAAYELCAAIIKEYPEIKYILGHEEIAPGRKSDPGPAFPLDKFRNDFGLPFSDY